ncbi:MAG TPA: prepilin-type N-terminal cleavage/methylation domain-containing protein [Mariprofundaceae bacterium]|nr:prepilin-type N-terminal cleavage/methylation domain-containing protein [Mariprofundaceae bacterium]
MNWNISTSDCTYIKLQASPKGFTLIELMISVAIIGILVAIALPSFSQYRVRAFNSSAESYIHFIATAEEAYYTDYQLYIQGGVALGPSPTGIIPNSTIPSGVGSAVGAFPVTGVDAATGFPTGTNFVGFSGHLKGDRVYAADNIHHIEWRPSNPPDPATDAQAENITQLIPNGWGSPL